MGAKISKNKANCPDSSINDLARIKLKANGA